MNEKLEKEIEFLNSLKWDGPLLQAQIKRILSLEGRVIPEECIFGEKCCIVCNPEGIKLITVKSTFSLIGGSSVITVESVGGNSTLSMLSFSTLQEAIAGVKRVVGLTKDERRWVFMCLVEMMFNDVWVNTQAAGIQGRATMYSAERAHGQLIVTPNKHCALAVSTETGDNNDVFVIQPSGKISMIRSEAAETPEVAVNMASIVEVSYAILAAEAVAKMAKNLREAKLSVQAMKEKNEKLRIEYGLVQPEGRTRVQYRPALDWARAYSEEEGRGEEQGRPAETNLSWPF